jgi:hypothetical protein
MDDFLRELFLPTIETRSGDLDEAALNVWIAQLDPFIIDAPGPGVIHDRTIDELVNEESTAVAPESSTSAWHLPKILPAGLVKPAPRKRTPLYHTLHLQYSYISKRMNKKPMEKGNNIYGRMGTLRCELCRKRRLKVP